MQMLTEADDKQYINLTPEWMKEKFDAMNKLLFNGELKPCKLSLFTTGEGSRGKTLGWFKHGTIYCSSSKTSYGHKKPCYVRDMWGDKIWLDTDNFNRYANPEIQLNGNYNWTEKAALSTLVHEMCHYYDYKDGWAPVQAHGPSFRSIAAMVSSKSNEFFTVQRLAKAEQMDEMEFTDNMKAFNNKRAAKGIRYFKIELQQPALSARGIPYKFAYAIPSSTIAGDYANYFKSNGSSNIARVLDCTTTDGNIKKYRMVTKVGKWYCCGNANSFDDVLADVKANSEVEIAISGETQRLEKPWYLFRFEYKTPYKQGGRVYPWGYIISKPADYFTFRNVIINKQGNEAMYADCYDIYDARILGHKPSNPKSPSINYISQSENVLPSIEKEGCKVMYDNRPKAKAPTGNYNDRQQPTPVQPAPAPVKRYTFSIPLMKNGMPSGTFTINNATEEEAKEQMRQRFPGWSPQVIEAKFQKYAKPLQQSSIALQESLNRQKKAI